MLRKIAKGSAEYKFFKKELERKIEPLLHKWETATGLECSYFIVRDMKTRWGVCNRKTKRITFNLQLIFYPEEAIELVVLHELLHFECIHHGQDFKSEFTRYMPDWKERTKLLKPVKTRRSPAK